MSRRISFHCVGVINFLTVDDVGCGIPAGTAFSATLDIALGVDLGLAMFSIIGPAIMMLVARMTSTMTSLSSLEGVLNSLVIAAVNSFHNENVADL